MTDEDKDKADLDAYDKAMEEHLKNPIVYSQAEVQKMLKIDFKTRRASRRYNHPGKTI